MALILGIETSCDETAAAVVEDGRRIRSNVIATQIVMMRLLDNDLTTIPLTIRRRCGNRTHPAEIVCGETFTVFDHVRQ